MLSQLGTEGHTDQQSDGLLELLESLKNCLSFLWIVTTKAGAAAWNTGILQQRSSSYPINWA